MALSELADRDFLASMAKETNGLSWFANEVNEVHRIFSDLFLSLKKPQVLELTKEGFEIDSSSNEATFFVSRKQESDSIVVIDPNLNEYTNKEFPGNWKWFRGPLFDVITVPQPLPGNWLINGSDGEISGFAKLLTNLNLEHDWPDGTLSIGDNAILKVRLTGDNTILNDPQIKDLIFYSYKVINTKTGSIFVQGKLLDDGTHGDELAADNIFSSSIVLNEEGDFKIFVSAIGPTFSRQRHIPVSVTRGLISLEHIPPNEFTKTSDAYVVRLHGEALELKNKKVSLVSEIVGKANSGYSLKLEPTPEHNSVYNIDVNLLKEGENKVFAVISGLDTHAHETRAKSEELVIVGKPHAKNESSAEHSENHEAEKVEGATATEAVEATEPEVPSEPSYWLYGLIGPFLSVGAGMGLALMFIRRSKQEKGVSIEVRPEYIVPPELDNRLKELVGRASTTRKRVLTPDEIELFSVIPELAQELSSLVETMQVTSKIKEQSSEEAEAEG